MAAPHGAATSAQPKNRNSSDDLFSAVGLRDILPLDRIFFRIREHCYQIRPRKKTRNNQGDTAMRQSLSTLAAAALILLASMISGTGCHRKPAPVTPPPQVKKEAPTTQQTPPAPSPTITLNVSP